MGDRVRSMPTKHSTVPCRRSGEKGYLGTSVGDLTEAMDINRPSLYAAFGNKRALYRLALERYFEDRPGT